MGFNAARIVFYPHLSDGFNHGRASTPRHRRRVRHPVRRRGVSSNDNLSVGLCWFVGWVPIVHPLD